MLNYSLCSSINNRLNRFAKPVWSALPFLLFTFCFLLFTFFLSAQSDDEMLAAQYYQNKEYDKAAAIYSKLYEKNSNPFFYNNYLNCLFELKDFKDAEKIIKKRIKKDPSALKFRVDLGYMYLRADQKPKAVKEFESAIKELKGDYDQTVDLANGFVVRDQLDYAVKAYQRSRDILKNNYVFNLEIADVYERLADYKDMFEEYLNYVENNTVPLESIESKLQITLSNDPDNKKNDLFNKILISRIQQKPDNTVFPEVMLWHSIQKKDFQSAFAQAKVLDRLFRQNGEKVLYVADLCFSNKEYDIAADAYEYVLKKGSNNPYYVTCNLKLLQVKYLQLISSFHYKKEDFIDLENKYIDALNTFGKNNGSVKLIQTLAHIQAFYLDKHREAEDLLNEVIKMQQISPDDKAQCKLELADIMLLSGDVWEATLLYSQVEKDFKHDTIGFTAKFKNAKLYYYIGEFKWAKAQLDILKAATSKLIANDAMDLYLIINDNLEQGDSTNVPLRLFASADLLTFRNQDDIALLTLDSIFKLYPGDFITDRALFKKAQIKIREEKYDAADTLLDKIISTYPDGIMADVALFRLAELQQYHYKNKDKAMELYEKFIKTYPSSIYVVDARKRFRQLRGDIIN